LLAMDIIQRVALAYYDLIAAKDQVKTREKALELAQQLVSENRQKVDVGRLAPLDVRQAESLEATARADLTAARFTVEEVENLLKGLISHDFSRIQATALEPAEKLVPAYQALSLPDSWRNGIENRPDYLAEKENVEKRNIELQYRRNQLFPALDLVGTYGRNGLAESTLASFDHIADNRFPYYGGGLVLTLPLQFKSERAQYKRADLQKKAAIDALKRREHIIMLDIDTAIKKARSAYDRTESTRAARRFAEEALDAEQKRFTSGNLTAFMVLRTQTALTDARAAEIQAVADYNKSLYELYFREGTILSRSKVEFEIE
jgi:outer membrane protein TolC